MSLLWARKNRGFPKLTKRQGATAKSKRFRFLNPGGLKEGDLKKKKKGGGTPKSGGEADGL